MRMRRVKVTLKINGRVLSRECEPAKTLLDFIREDIGLKGTKRGCEIGECGACTVIMNGEAVNSCMVLVPQAEGAEITTIEGVSGEGELHPVQKAFMEKGALQCGYCTPGMILTAICLLKGNPSPSRNEIRRALAGNLCRCTGYRQIIDAVEYAAVLMKK